MRIDYISIEQKLVGGESATKKNQEVGLVPIVNSRIVVCAPQSTGWAGNPSRPARSFSDYESFKGFNNVNIEFWGFQRHSEATFRIVMFNCTLGIKRASGTVLGPTDSCIPQNSFIYRLRRPNDQPAPCSGNLSLVNARGTILSTLGCRVLGSCYWGCEEGADELVSVGLHEGWAFVQSFCLGALFNSLLIGPFSRSEHLLMICFWESCIPMIKAFCSRASRQVWDWAVSMPHS